MISLLENLNVIISRSHTQKSKDLIKSKKKSKPNIDKQQYKKLIEDAADDIVSSSCDLIEEGQDDLGHICPDTDRISDIVDDLMWDLPNNQKKNMITNNQLYQYSPSYEYYPDDLFVEKNEGIFMDCIADVRREVIKMSEALFWDHN